MSLQLKFEYALNLHQQGHWVQAQSIYEQILAEQPRHFDALHLLGVIAANGGDSRRALQLIDKALEIDPGNAAAHFNRGTALQALKLWTAALACYDKAVDIQPDFAEAHSNRGVVQTELKQWDAALSSCGRAIACRPGYAEAHFNRGNVHRQLRQWHPALLDYSRAIAIKGTYAEAYFNRGNVHRELEQWQAALADYDQAIAFRPGYASAYYNRGNVLRDLHQPDSALADYRHAIALEPGLEFLPGEILSIMMGLCDWREMDADIAQLAAAIERGEAVCNPFIVLTFSGSAMLQKKAAQIWVRETSAPVPAMPAIARRAGSERIRIGYFSADFHDHATAHLIAGLFETHDAARFEVTAFSFGPNSPCEMRNRLKAACREFLEVGAHSDAQTAELARARGIDIAVDLKGFTRGNRAGIFSHRAAPIQVNYLGYPGTMGAGAIDYLMADRTVVPDESRLYYTEKIICLPGSYQVNDAKRPIAPKIFARAELGLPREGFVFCCFNNNVKIMPRTFDVWMRILRRVKGSVLWLLSDDPRVAANLRREAASRHVEPARLVFAGRLDLPHHLARHRAADLFIDTLPCNAHTTASDALWAGLPVLTCGGEAFASRVAASLLNAMGLPELVASSQLQYEELAVSLAADPQRLANIRQSLTERRLTAPLFDIVSYTRHVEAAYARIFERHQAQLPAEHIYVDL